MDSSKEQITVAIIGGGLGGICTALKLLEYPNIRTIIYEGAAQFAEIGAGILVGPNARRAIKLINHQAYEDFRKLQTGNLWPEHKYNWYEFRYSSGPCAGETITKVQSEMGQSSFHRAKLMECLLRLIPDEMKQTGKRLTTIEDLERGVRLYFEDGTTAKADCVIGADGIKSMTRRYVFAENWKDYEPRFSGVVGYRGLIPMQEGRQIVGDEIAMNSFTMCGEDTVSASFPIDFGETFNLIATTTDNPPWEGPWVQPVAFSEIKEKFRKLPEEQFKLIKALDRPGVQKWSIWYIPDISTSHRNNVCIIGDAAHATVPMHAAGAGQAIEDALIMATVLGNANSLREIPAAFRAYDKLRLPRALRNGKESFDAVEIFSLRKPGVMYDKEKLVEAIEYRMDWIWNRDIALQQDQARLIMQNIIQHPSKASMRTGHSATSNGDSAFLQGSRHEVVERKTESGVTTKTGAVQIVSSKLDI